MARRHPDDGRSSDELPTAADGNGGLPRRGYLKAAGLAVASAAGLGAAAGGASAAEYRTVTVPAGDRRQFTLGDGETLENLLIDVTADGADARIMATGNDWTIRNVGVRGQFTGGRDSGGYSNVLHVEGNGVVENVYLGDGHVHGVRKGAIGSGPSHAGHVELRNVHVQGWAGNAVYAAGMGRVNPPGKTDGRGGTLAFRDCYFANNNIAHLRIASDGTVVEGCVFTNTNDVPPHPNTSSGASGVVNSRGIYTGYGDPSQTITVRDSHFDVTAANTNGGASAVVSGTHSTYGDLTTVRLVDSEVRGDLVGGQVVTENVGSNPDTSIPDGTPANAEEAASATPGSGGDQPDDGDDGTDWRSLSIVGGSASNVVSYDFQVGGEVEKTTARNATRDADDEMSDDGRVTGTVAGGTDSYRFTGEVAAFDASDDVTVYLDGQQVDQADLGGDDDSDDAPAHVLTIQGGNASNLVTYTLGVSDSLERTDANGATVDPEDSVVGSTATGGVAGGADSYRFTGEVTAFDADGEVTVTLDGEAVDPADLGGDGDDSPSPRTLTIRGGSASNPTSYTLRTTGSAKRSSANSATVDPEDSVIGSTATGVVAGGADSYRVTGEVAAFDADGTVTVTLDGEEVAPADLGS